MINFYSCCEYHVVDKMCCNEISIINNINLISITNNGYINVLHMDFVKEQQQTVFFVNMSYLKFILEDEVREN